MAAARGRKKRSRRRSPKTMSLWSLGVGYVYLAGMTKMALGSNPIQFITGKYDLGYGDGA